MFLDPRRCSLRSHCRRHTARFQEYTRDSHQDHSETFHCRRKTLMTLNKQKYP